MPASPEPPTGILPATAENIRRAADAVRAGELVVIPTETVYGVAARADSPAALARLYAAKGRDESKRMALFADGIGSVRAAGVRVDEIAERLAAAFWPGPLTMVLETATGGWNGFRVPDHPVALAWLRELRGVVPAVTSANRSGEPPAPTAQEAWAALAPHVSLALDAGPVAGGVPSTVVKVGPEGVEILRAGVLSGEAIAKAAGCPVKG
ncbi:MAG TPA: threonylcarbamoyl-AMP synthase [Verrucomicrobia bacterium]|nr:threonylcarbamoyl-AMP synthase [Verrucomicrobiota bacterium]